MRLRIATLNCLNLAMPGRAVYAGVPAYTADEYIAKTQWLATMVDRLAADLLLFQEVFHAEALSDVLRQSALGARGWAMTAPLAEQGNDKPRLALAWRQPLAPTVGTIADFPPGCAVEVPELGTHARFSRPLLRAALPLPPSTGAAQLTVYNVHLKSRRPDFAPGEREDDPAAEARAQVRSLIKRGAEAAALRRLVLESLRGAATPVVVAGDFNDTLGAVSTQVVADTSWRRGDRPAGDAMLFDARAVERRLVPGGTGDRGRHTILHGGEPETIDHVLVSGEFVPGSRRALGRVRAVEVFNDHLDERMRAERIGDPSFAALARVASDHAAVCVTLEFGKD